MTALVGPRVGKEFLELLLGLDLFIVCCGVAARARKSYATGAAAVSAAARSRAWK